MRGAAHPSWRDRQAGFFFGNLSFVKANFGVVVVAIILLSILPAVVEMVRHRRVPPPAGDLA